MEDLLLCRIGEIYNPKDLLKWSDWFVYDDEENDDKGDVGFASVGLSKGDSVCIRFERDDIHHDKVVVKQIFFEAD